MPTVHKSLPAERTGTPASPELLERRTKFVATEIDPALGVAAGDADFAGVPCRTIRAGDRATILYLHGGGYRMGSPEAYNAYAAALAVDADEWRTEIPLIEEWFEFVGDKLPSGVRDEFEALKQRIQ